MGERQIKKPKANAQPLWTTAFQEFPKEKDGIIYVRQSSLAQMRKNVHSFEMQTDRFLEHFRNMGCTGHIEVIADDEAMSGTLDIHARPGMTRMVKTIESHKVGWIAAVAVNRFTRDPWLITPALLMKICHDNDVWIATLRTHFNFKDDYCQRVFMLEAEEAANYLKMMKLIMGGAWRLASSNGYYDGRTLAPGYIVDRSDPRRKKYVIYEPHAEVVRWLFERFLELDGNFRGLCREVERMPYLFPKYEAWVDTKGIRRRKDPRTTVTPEGHYKPTMSGIKSILTNPVYIGWWLPIDGGIIENNHEPIVDEGLFIYAHKRISPYDLRGDRQKPVRVTRNGQMQALLKKVIEGPAKRPVYILYDDYVCRTQTTLSSKYEFAMLIRTTDAIFLEKFLERLATIDPEEFSDWEEKVGQIAQVKEGKRRLIQQEIKKARDRMKEIMADLRDSEIPLTKAMKIAYAEEHAGLEQKVEELEKDLERESPEEEESTEEVLYEINTIIPDIVREWHNLKLETQMRVVGALTRRVVLSHIAPAWMKIEIEWKRPEWDIDIAHIKRTSNRDLWTQEDEQILREMYATADAADLLSALPDRSWSAIQDHARKRLGLERLRTHPNSVPANKLYRNMSIRDVEYAREHGLDASNKKVQWSL